MPEMPLLKWQIFNAGTNGLFIKIDAVVGYRVPTTTC